MSNETTSSSDIDPTLQAWFQSLTPLQRLQVVQDHANFIVAVRGLERVLADRERDDRLPLLEAALFDEDE